ncbi:hypothetical protein PsYK624_172680 [Phanerochaete sordida]|uniref:Uncharacterized protein n=1 Tax=Phanerochaete sordida TaxID=48140 RepID=A0A9P3LML0_9APHY|nr:hypothetical protein PsYK624_172680 [Phanerochaete sordida]
MARLHKLQQGPHFDKNGDEYVPASDCEGESNYELRIPDPSCYLNGRRPPLRLTRPTPRFPGTWNLYSEVIGRPEHRHLDPTSSLLDRVVLQEMARKEYLQRVLDGYEREPTDRELRYLMRPYSLCSIDAE